VQSEFQAELRDFTAMSGARQALLDRPTDTGGYGYSKSALPHPNCPMCDGLGEAYPYYPDSRTYSRAAQRAFDGVAITANGMKINTQDRMAATVNIAKHHAMFTSDEAGKAVDSLSALIGEIQQRGSKAPIGGRGDAPVEPDEG
jgi:phage terminase small subunit